MQYILRHYNAISKVFLLRIMHYSKSWSTKGELPFISFSLSFLRLQLNHSCLSNHHSSSQTIQKTSNYVESNTHPNLPPSVRSHHHHLYPPSRSPGWRAKRSRLQIHDSLPRQHLCYGDLHRFRILGAPAAASRATKQAFRIRTGHDGR